MKNYFNHEETLSHIMLMAAQAKAEEFCDSQSITEEERKYVKSAVSSLKKFTESVFIRLGDPYQRKIVRSLNDNQLKLAGRGTVERSALLHAPIEDLTGRMKEVQSISCMFCDNENYKECAIYAMFVALGVEATSSKGCPFCLDIGGDLPEDDF